MTDFSVPPVYLRAPPPFYLRYCSCKPRIDLDIHGQHMASIITVNEQNKFGTQDPLSHTADAVSVVGSLVFRIRR
jgi:hypothetical protein